MGWRVAVALGLLAVYCATLYVMYTGDLPVHPGVRNWLTGFLVVVLIGYAFYTYFASVEDRLRRWAAGLLIFSGVLICTKVVLGWTVNFQVQGVFQFLLAKGDTIVEIVALIVAVVFVLGGIFLIWLGHINRNPWAPFENKDPTSILEILLKEISGDSPEHTKRMRKLLDNALFHPNELASALRPSLTESVPLLFKALDQFEKRLRDLLEIYPTLRILKGLAQSIENLRIGREHSVLPVHPTSTSIPQNLWILIENEDLVGIIRHLLEEISGGSSEDTKRMRELLDNALLHPNELASALRPSLTESVPLLHDALNLFQARLRGLLEIYPSSRILNKLAESIQKFLDC